MKRWVLIAIAAPVALASAGAGIYLYRGSAGDSGNSASAEHSGRKVETLASAEGRGAERAAELRRLVEELGAVQDRAVQGDESARAEQGRILMQTSELLRTFDTEDWKNAVNVRGAFVYVLSGGDYGVLKPLADDEQRYDVERNLAQGIMFFAQGKSSDARKLLSDVDPRSLDVRLVGPFALARASFYIGHDAAKAIALLDEARLASPHTAIEEAAARREIPLLIEAGDLPRAMAMLNDYLRRFGKSVYARKLFRNVAVAASKRDELDNANTVGDIVTGASSADNRASIDLFLTMAEEALPRGRLSLAKAAASEALSLQAGAAENSDRAKLYLAAAEAPTTRAADALSVLHQIGDAGLSGSDRDIHGAAGFIARTVTRDHAILGRDVQKPRAQQADLDPAQPAPSNAQDWKSVENSVKGADAALQDADKIMSGNFR